MNYRSDHIKLLKVFAAALPKKTCFPVADLAKAAFTGIEKRKPDCKSLNPDRACRNALRKPRAEGHIEIAERGEYRLTAAGAAFCKKLDGYAVAPDKKSGEKKPKTAKKVAAKTPTKTAKATAKAPAKAPAKVAAKAPVKAPVKKEAKPAAKAKEEKAPAAKAENTKPRKRLIPGLKPKEEKAAEAPAAEAPKADVPAQLAL